MEGDVLGAVFQHMDKGLSAVLLVFFVVKLLPQLNKLADAIGDMKDIVNRLESQSDKTEKEFIKTNEYLKYRREIFDKAPAQKQG